MFTKWNGERARFENNNNNEQFKYYSCMDSVLQEYLAVSLLLVGCKMVISKPALFSGATAASLGVYSIPVFLTLQLFHLPTLDNH